MLLLRNRTPFASLLFVAPDLDGIDSVYTVIKGTFDLGSHPVPSPAQLPVVSADEYAGEPGKSSLKAASDLCLVKPGTDVLLTGSAYPPDGKPATRVEVSLSVGPVHKTVNVVGDRRWQAGLLFHSPTAPEPFERMPLVWERAFGGSDRTEGEEPKLFSEPRNPVGAGFRTGKGQTALDGLRLPNLEAPGQRISSWRSRPTPAAFAPICPDWEPRRTYAGTYDADWLARRIPYLPGDFDPRFFQVAPRDLVAPGYLEGGEPVEIRGATPGGLLRFQLPRYRVRVAYRLDSRWHDRPAPLDTVWIEPDEARLVLTWRAAFRCDKKVLRVREIEPIVEAD